MEGQDLKGIGDKKTRETDVVEDTEDPDEDQLSVAGALVCLVRVSIDGAGDGPAHKGADHAEDGGEEERPTTELVNGQGSANCDAKIENRLAGGNTELLVLASDSGSLVDGAHVLGEQSVTRVLGDNAERDDDGQPPAVALGAEEIEVGRGLVGVLLDLDGLLDLAELELDSSVVGVATGVPLGKNRKSLLLPILVDEVTGGLRDPPDEDELDDRGHDLDESDGPPRPVAVDGSSAPADARNDQCAKVPQAVVDGSDGTTVLRVADFREKQRRGHLSEGVTETENKATTQVHCKFVSSDRPRSWYQVP